MKPHKDRVLVRVLPPQEKVVNGIILGEEKEVTYIPRTGFIEAIGDDVEEGIVELGDRVLFKPSCFNLVAENLHVMKLSCIEAILDKDTEYDFESKKQSI